ncbi:MAG: DMT family transporter [Nitrososphaerales archaeon]
MGREAEIALAETALAAALWGTSFPVVSLGIEGGLDPRTFVFLRFAIAAPVMLGVALALGRDVMPLLRSRALWVVGLFNAVGFVCQFIGQQYTEASVAALLVNMSVILAAIGAVVFLGERLGGFKVVGIFLAVAGVFLITTNGDFGVVASGQGFGDALYLIAAVSWAGYILYSKKKMDEQRWDPLASAACIVAVTAILVVPPALTAGVGPSLSSESLRAVAYTAVINTVIPFVLYQQGLKHLTASSSAVVLMLEIVVAVMISVAFLGETLTAFAWIGALAVLASIFLVSGVEISGKSLSVRVPEASRVEDA